ncbi:hypothetical protein [Selenomonas ruminantium]|nr:hypothetical protein [Selenomonas ruminantium]
MVNMRILAMYLVALSILMAALWEWSTEAKQIQVAMPLLIG